MGDPRLDGGRRDLEIGRIDLDRGRAAQGLAGEDGLRWRDGVHGWLLLDDHSLVDLAGEEREIERTGQLVGVDVLTVLLAARDEELAPAGHGAAAARPDADGLG